jgi:hypothetical protein
MNVERRKDESDRNHGGRMTAIRPHRTLPPLWRLYAVRRMADKASKLSNTCAAKKLRLTNGEITRLAGPHFRHLVTQAPHLKRLQQIAHFVEHGADFLLIIHKSIRPNIRNGIVVLADISQNAQKPLQAGAIRLPKLPAVRGHEQ